VIEELIYLIICAECCEAHSLSEDEIAFYGALKRMTLQLKWCPADYSTGTGGHSLQDHSWECPCTDACACKAYPTSSSSKQEKATQTVLMQAEVLSQEWVVV